MLNTYEFLKNISSNGVLNANLHATTLTVQGIALLLAPILFVVNVMHNFWGTTTSFTGQIFNKKELIRLWVVYGFIVIYPAIFTPVMFVVDLVNTASSLDDKAYNDYVNAITSYSDNALNYSVSANSGKLTVDSLSQNNVVKGQTAGGDLLSFFVSPVNFMNMVVNGIVVFFAGILHLVIGTVCVYLFKILYVLGPMAFCFSLSPFSKNQVDIWLGTFLNVGFTLFTFNILQKLMVNQLIASFNSVGASGTTNPYTDATFGIVILILYLCCFWLTSKFVGVGDGGKVLSSAMQAMQTVAQVKMGFGADMSKNGGAVDDATKTGADSMKQQ